MTLYFPVNEARLEGVLRDVEAMGENHGWGVPESTPTLFGVFIDKGGELHWDIPGEINYRFHILTHQFMGDPGSALRHMAEAMESDTTDQSALVGIGIRCEAHRLDGAPGEDYEALVAEVLAAGPDGSGPRMVETRFVEFYCRDGRQMRVDRDRGSVPEYSGHSDHRELAGSIANGMGRLLNSLVPEDVHIPPMRPEAL